MSYTSGSAITAADFDSLLDAVEKVYASGTGDYGYGQTAFVEVDVERSDVIRALEWGTLKGMLVTCANQQGTTTTSLFVDPSTGGIVPSVVSASTMLPSIQSNRLVAVSDALRPVSDVTTATRAVNWNGVIETIIDVSFTTEDQARYFFNSGGQVTVKASHAQQITATDKNFSAFLASQFVSLSLGARKVTLNNGSGTVINGGFYDIAADFVLINKQTSSTSLSANGADFIAVYAKRTGFVGDRGGNGTGFQFKVVLQCLGDADGSYLSSGTAVGIDLLKASKYLTVVAPSCANTGLSLTQRGNGAGDPSNGDPQGTVINPTPFTPGVGTREYIVPEYATITFELWGGGGSEGPSTGPIPRSDNAKIFLTPGVAGGSASISALGLAAQGGTGGGFYDPATGTLPAAGIDGSGSRGDVNTTGGGGAGGRDRYAAQTSWRNGGKGGAGAYVKKTYVRGTAGAPAPGTVLVLTVPAGGTQSAITVPTTSPPNVFYPGADGANGSIKVTYTVASSGSVQFNVRGNYQFTVPPFTNMTVKVLGPGGGQSCPITYTLPIGVGLSYFNTSSLITGSAGGTSAVPVLGLQASGGQGSTNAIGNPMPGGAIITFPGTAGTGSGGDVSSTGGGSGGGFREIPPNMGNARYYANHGDPGGDGGYTAKTFASGAPGAPTVGQVLGITVGAGGAAAALSTEAITGGWSNANGDDGLVSIEWTYSGAPVVDNPV